MRTTMKICNCGTCRTASLKAVEIIRQLAIEDNYCPIMVSAIAEAISFLAVNHAFNTMQMKNRDEAYGVVNQMEANSGRVADWCIANEEQALMPGHKAFIDRALKTYRES